MSQRQIAIANRAPLKRWLKYARQPKRTVGELLAAMLPEMTETQK